SRALARADTNSIGSQADLSAFRDEARLLVRKTSPAEASDKLAKTRRALNPERSQNHRTSERGFMARRTINRMEKRTEYEVYEASQRGKNEDEEELEQEEDEEDKDEEAQAGSEDADDEEDAEEPKPKKKKPAKEPKPRSRARTAKLPRLKVVW